MRNGPQEFQLQPLWRVRGPTAGCRPEVTSLPGALPHPVSCSQQEAEVAQQLSPGSLLDPGLALSDHRGHGQDRGPCQNLRVHPGAILPDQLEIQLLTRRGELRRGSDCSFTTQSESKSRRLWVPLGSFFRKTHPGQSRLAHLQRR